MTVYVLTINYSAWEDPESNGCTVYLYDSKEKALKRMEEKIKEEIEEEKEYGRDFYESQRFEGYVSLVSQHSEYVEFEVVPQEVM